MQSYATEAASNTPRPATNFDHMNRALDRANLLAERVESLVNTLLGPQPQPPCVGTKLSEVSSGLLNCVGASAQNTCDRIVDAMDALDRVQRTLP